MLFDKKKLQYREIVGSQHSKDSYAYGIPIASNAQNSAREQQANPLARKKSHNSLTEAIDQSSAPKQAISLHQPQRRKSCHCEQCGQASSKARLIDQLYPATYIKKFHYQEQYKKFLKLNLLGQSLQRYLSHEIDRTTKFGESRKAKASLTCYLSEKAQTCKHVFGQDKSLNKFSSYVDNHNNTEKKPAGFRSEKFSYKQSSQPLINEFSSRDSPRQQQCVTPHAKTRGEQQNRAEEANPAIRVSDGQNPEEFRARAPKPKSKTQIFQLKPRNMFALRNKKPSVALISKAQNLQLIQMQNLKQCRSSVFKILETIKQTEEEKNELKKFAQEHNFSGAFQTATPAAKKTDAQSQQMKFNKQIYSNIFNYSNNLKNAILQDYIQEKLGKAQGKRGKGTGELPVSASLDKALEKYLSKKQFSLPQIVTKASPRKKPLNLSQAANVSQYAQSSEQQLQQQKLLLQKIHSSDNPQRKGKQKAAQLNLISQISASNPSGSTPKKKQ